MRRVQIKRQEYGVLGVAHGIVTLRINLKGSRTEINAVQAAVMNTLVELDAMPQTTVRASVPFAYDVVKKAAGDGPVANRTLSGEPWQPQEMGGMRQ